MTVPLWRACRLQDGNSQLAAALEAKYCKDAVYFTLELQAVADRLQTAAIGLSSVEHVCTECRINISTL